MHDCMSIICICFQLTNIISLNCYDTTEGKRGRGRSRMTWSQVVEKDMRNCRLKREDAKDTERWRRLLCRAAGQPVRKQGKRP